MGVEYVFVPVRSAEGRVEAVGVLALKGREEQGQEEEGEAYGLGARRTGEGGGGGGGGGDRGECDGFALGAGI